MVCTRRGRVTITWTGADGKRRRVTFVPDRGDRDGRRIEEVRRGCDWRVVGRETIANVVIDVESGAASSTTAGP